MIDYKVFWVKQHEEQTYWLTGTDISNIFSFYNLLEEYLRDKKVLEIGVGNGSFSNSVTRYTSEFYACDISEKALTRISANAKKTFLTEELNQCDPVDIAICHLVLVHCTDEEAIRIINDIPLAENGKAYIQFSEKVGGVDPKIQENLIDNGTHFFRTLDESKELINQTNKKIDHISRPYNPGGYKDYDLKQNWHFVTLVNK